MPRITAANEEEWRKDWEAAMAILNRTSAEVERLIDRVRELEGALGDIIEVPGQDTCLVMDEMIDIAKQALEGGSDE